MLEPVASSSVFVSLCWYSRTAEFSLQTVQLQVSQSRLTEWPLLYTYLVTIERFLGCAESAVLIVNNSMK